MHTSTTLLVDREDLERALAHRWDYGDRVQATLRLGTFHLVVDGDDIPLLAATLHRLADELTAAQRSSQSETVYSEAQAVTL